MSKQSDWESVATALMKLGAAFKECTEAFNNVDEGELNEIITDNYPFELSFDELNLEVLEWEKECRKEIHNQKLS